jgi:hypothetical protein
MRDLNYQNPRHRFIQRAFAGLWVVYAIVGIIGAITYAVTH